MRNSPATLKKRNALKRHWKRITDPGSFPHSIQKQCKACGKIGTCDWLSSFTQTGIPEYKARCRNCQREYLNALRRGDRHKLYRNISRKKALSKRKRWAVNLLGGECIKCGYRKSLYGLTFHHRDPKKKGFDVGSKLVDKSKRDLKKELRKCDLLCFNCHMELGDTEGGVEGVCN